MQLAVMSRAKYINKKGFGGCAVKIGLIHTGTHEKGFIQIRAKSVKYFLLRPQQLTYFHVSQMAMLGFFPTILCRVQDSNSRQ